MHKKLGRMTANDTGCPGMAHTGPRADDREGSNPSDGEVRTGVASGSLVQTDPMPCLPVTGEADKPATPKPPVTLVVGGLGGVLISEIPYLRRSRVREDAPACEMMFHASCPADVRL